MNDWPVIQVALDFTNLDRAIKAAEEAVKGGVDWIEVGTPLIKSEGVRAIRELKRRFPNKTIVADMKTMDTGALEVEMAARAGADVVVLLGAADNSTIEDAMRSARKYGVKIAVDTIGVDKIVERCKELERIGVDYLIVHIGIDQQMLGMDPLELLRKVRDEVEIPIGVAGGLNAEKARIAYEEGADILIVGGSIIRADDIEEAARKIVKAVKSERRSKKSAVERRKELEEEIMDILREVSTPNIADASHREGVMKGIRMISGGKIVGRAVTVKVMAGDWAKAIEAIDQAGKGDVIVIDAGGAEVSVWGELATWSCKTREIEGVVIDGAVRDVKEIKEIGLPVFARYVNPEAGEAKGYGEIGCVVEVGGVKVKPGDYVVGDENGVVVVPKERGLEIAKRALQVKEMENRIREEIRRGSTLSKVIDIYKWERLI